VILERMQALSTGAHAAHGRIARGPLSKQSHGLRAALRLRSALREEAQPSRVWYLRMDPLCGGQASSGGGPERDGDGPQGIGRSCFSGVGAHTQKGEQAPHGCVLLGSAPGDLWLQLTSAARIDIVLSPPLATRPWFSRCNL